MNERTVSMSASVAMNANALGSTRNDSLVARLVDERVVVRAVPEGGRWLVPTLSGMAVADGLAAAFDLSRPN
jgi:hypothetical protein